MNETVNQEMNEVSAKEPRTFTQEEVDHLIGERLFREREKYAGLNIACLEHLGLSILE